jgi:hypothetical protein
MKCFYFFSLEVITHLDARSMPVLSTKHNDSLMENMIIFIYRFYREKIYRFQ